MTEPTTTSSDDNQPKLAGGPYLGGPGNDAGYTAGLPRPNHADEIPDVDDAAKDTIAASGSGLASGSVPADAPATEGDPGATNPS